MEVRSPGKNRKEPSLWGAEATKIPPASAIPAIWTPILGCPLRPPKSYLSVRCPDLKNLTYSDTGPWCVLRRECSGMIHNSYGINPSNPQQPIQQPYVKRTSK